MWRKKSRQVLDFSAPRVAQLRWLATKWGFIQRFPKQLGRSKNYLKMETLSTNKFSSNHTLVQDNFRTQQTNKTYALYKRPTPTKWAHSKLKNLAYTLSRPFRSLMKGHIEKSIGTRNSMDAMKNINAPTTSIRKTGADSTSSPKTSGTVNTANNGQSNYTIVGGTGGQRSTLAERLWG